MIIMDATAFSGFARKTAESVSDFVSVARNLIMDIRDCYRPGPYHMRGPGQKWRSCARRARVLARESVLRTHG
jgi:hypothetical protein